MTVTDAYPRVISEILIHESKYLKDKKHKEKIYNWSIFFIPLVSLSILFLFQGSFTRLVDFAAGLSFLSAPFLGWFNYKLVTGKEMPISSRPEKAYRTFSLTCLFLLVLFNLLYIY